MGNSAKVTLTVEAFEVLNSGIKAGVIPSTFLEKMDLRSGTADGQIDLVYAVTTTAVAAGGTTEYDLDGVLEDSFGNVITFAEVNMIAVRNKRSTALAWLQVGPAAATGFGTLTANKGFWLVATDRSNVGPDSWLVLYDKVGVPVTGALKDLAIDTSAVVGATNSWDLLILGRSA